MTADLALAADPGFIERSADPGEFIIQACERTKTWLAEPLEHGEIDQIVEIKSQAETIRVYTVQKQLGMDAQLSVTEIVRRAERGIGLAIRRGQEAGAIRSHRTGNLKIEPGDTGGTRFNPRPVTDFAKSYDLAGGGGNPGIYALTDDVSDEDFEGAVAEAKAEGNLSRANVVRKARGRAAKTAVKNDEWIPVADDRTTTGAVQRRKLIRQWAAQGYNSRQMSALLGIEDKGIRKIARQCEIDIAADKVIGRSHLLDSARIVRETVHSLEGLVMGIELADLADIDPDDAGEWAASLTASIRVLGRFARKLKETSQ